MDRGSAIDNAPTSGQYLGHTRLAVDRMSQGLNGCLLEVDNFATNRSLEVKFERLLV